MSRWKFKDLVIFLVFAGLGIFPEPGKCMLPNQIRVAAIFDQDGDRKHELAFKYGVERVNREPGILPGKRLQAEIIRIPSGNR